MGVFFTMAIINKFRERLREAIDNSPKSQRSIAKDAKTSATSLQRWLSGENDISLNRLDDLATALNVSPYWLLGAEDPTSSKKAAIHEIRALIDQPDFEGIPPSIIEKLKQVKDLNSLQILEEFIDTAIKKEHMLSAKKDKKERA